MKNYIFREKGEFYGNRFNNEIDKAKIQIIENEGLDENSFNIIRCSKNTPYDNGIYYEGMLISYEISKENSIIGRLDCFMDIENTYVDITLWPY